MNDPHLASRSDSPTAFAGLEQIADAPLDRLARLATRLLGVPVALVTVIEADRQLFPGCVGLPEPWASRRATPLSHSFCRHVASSGQPLVIADARLHPLVKDNPAITDFGVIAYAGVPLKTPGGHVVGVFCAIDSAPRDWSTEDVGVLTDLAATAAAELELRDRARHAQLAVDVGRAMTAPAPLPEQLQQCAEALVAHLDAAFARIWVLDEATAILVLQASAGRYTHLDGAHARIPVGAWKIGRIAAERRPHLTNDVLSDPEVHDPAWARRERMVAFAGYPLLAGERLVGVMGLFAQHPLSEVTLQALGPVADAIAVGIDRAQAEAAREALLEREQEAREWAEGRAATLATVNRVGRLLAAELDIERLLQTVTDAATELTGAAFGAFFYNVVNDRGEAYQLYTLSGAPRDAFARFPLPRNTAIFGPTFRGEAVVRLADVRQDPRFGHNPPYYGLPPGHLPVASYLAVPVISRSGDVLGGLFFGHPEPGIFDERAEDLAVGLAAHAAIALDNARLLARAQSAETRYRSLFDGVADAILVADETGHYIDVNPAATELLGWSRDELLTMTIADVVAGEAGWAGAEFARFLEAGEWQGELELRRKDGSTVPVEARATVVALSDGPVYLSAIRDVTERRSLAQGQQEFLASVSHDLKNPLAALKGQTQLLQRRVRRLEGDGAAAVSEGLEQIIALTDRIAAQIEELLDTAHLNAGRPLELRYMPTDLVALARSSLEAYQATTQRHHLRLLTDEPELTGVWDTTRLRRAVENLLSNAIKYSPRGGDILLRLQRESDLTGAWAVLAVQDHGLGIPAADLPHLFTRFRRGSNVANRIAGSGIGLAGVKQIVEQHGGTIAVASTEGQGSTFTIRLPLAPPDLA